MFVIDTIECFHLLIGDFNAFVVNGFHQMRGDAQARLGCRRPQVLKDDINVLQHHARPMFGHLREKAVFNGIPF